MITFRAPEIEDRTWVEERFRASGNQGCEYSFTTLFLWSGAYRQQVAQMDGYALERLQGSLGPAYLFPAGSGPLEPVLAALEQDASDRGEPCRFVCLTPDQVQKLEELRPGGYQFTADRDGYDYLYKIDRLADLGGKKLHAKRNHINRFLERCPDWRIEEITMDNLAECAEMDLDWNRNYRSLDTADEAEEEQTRLDERHAMSKAFAHYEALGLSGILLRAGGRVVAFTMGSPINRDTFDIHFEKAYSDIQGAYPMINREFARWIRSHFPQIRWLNREDDMGMEGLRKAKESYYPDHMVEKSYAVRRESGSNEDKVG